jgi:hypothetical protein
MADLGLTINFNMGDKAVGTVQENAGDHVLIFHISASF